MVGRLDWRAAAILLAFLANWVWWLYDESVVVPHRFCTDVPDNCHRTMFLFYMLPDVPFMVLALTMAIGMVLRAGGLRRIGTAWTTRAVVTAAVVGVYLVGVGWNFGYFYPVLTGKVITYQQWIDRMWFDSTCDNKANRNQHHENAPCWI
jgi:hypothetical protein